MLAKFNELSTAVAALAFALVFVLGALFVAAMSSAGAGMFIVAFLVFAVLCGELGWARLAQSERILTARLPTPGTSFTRFRLVEDAVGGVFGIAMILALGIGLPTFAVVLVHQQLHLNAGVIVVAVIVVGWLFIRGRLLVAVWPQAAGSGPGGRGVALPARFSIPGLPTPMPTVRPTIDGVWVDFRTGFVWRPLIPMPPVTVLYSDLTEVRVFDSYSEYEAYLANLGGPLFGSPQIAMTGLVQEAQFFANRAPRPTTGASGLQWAEYLAGKTTRPTTVLKATSYGAILLLRGPVFLYILSVAPAQGAVVARAFADYQAGRLVAAQPIPPDPPPPATAQAEPPATASPAPVAGPGGGVTAATRTPAPAPLQIVNRRVGLTCAAGCLAVVLIGVLALVLLFAVAILHGGCIGDCSNYVPPSG